MKDLPKTRTNNILVQELEKELLVYDLQTNQAFCLNETSAFIWQMCDGRIEVAEISQALSRKFKQSANEDLVWLAIDLLKKDGLMANEDSLKSPLAGMNRREMVKKVGLASMIALPIVSSLVAPSAAMAASGGFPLLAACSVNPDCSSAFCRPCNPIRGFTCSSPKYCCNNFIAASPGALVDGCATDCFGLGSTECCSGQTVSSPSTCPQSGRVACTCA